MRKFIKDLWLIFVERHKIHKAMRLLSKQEWSVEFLVALLAKAAQVKRQNVHFVLKHKDGNALHIFANTATQQKVPTEMDMDIRREEVTLDSMLDAAEMRGIL